MRPRWGIMMGKCTSWVVNSQRMETIVLRFGVSEDLGGDLDMEIFYR